jgi:hypothetical protein
MTFPVLSANGPTGYNLTRSLRFRSSASAYLNRTPASATNQKTWTYSGWVKKSGLAAEQAIFCSQPDGFNWTEIYFRGTDNLTFRQYTSSTVVFEVVTNAVLRDVSAWYHIVIVLDTTQATAANRLILYVNGVQQTLTFNTGTYPAQNANLFINAANAHYIGQRSSAGYPNIYLTEVNFVDGQALTPSSFGSTNSTTGVWQPAAYKGTYGTNGFYLPFTNITSTTTLGYDFSGNSNNWTTNNISLTAGSTYDSMTDVPTLTSATAANYCTLNPLLSNNNITFSSANLNAAIGASGGIYRTAGGTIAVTTGKWYFEALATTPFINSHVGFGDVTQSKATWESDTSANTNFWYLNPINGSKVNGNGAGTSYGSPLSNGDIIMCALDIDNGKIWWGVNGTFIASGNPSAGTNAAFTNLSGFNLTPAFFGGSGSSGGSTQIANFGQRPFSYTPPTGYVALNTYNLPASTIQNGASYMAATLYTGTLLSNTIANTVGSASFQPDLVWIKSRSAATDHKLTDVVRGVTKALISDTTGAETTDTFGLTAFNSNGFTVSTNTDYNNSGATYVAWNWRAGGTAVSNTNGSITSSVSANTTSGFSVVTYTGTGANATVGHGLGVAPSMIIVKRRDSATNGDWFTYHASLGNTNAIYLNLGNASAASGGAWNNTSPTSSVFTVGTSTGVNASASTYVAYCFAAIKGFSAFGSYTGNASTDGPFVYTGFRPRWVLLKRADVAGDWHLHDTSRDTYNASLTILLPDSSSADLVAGNAFALDILSNGFKLRTTDGSTNASGSTFIYMAFAENPFQNALAR